MIFAVFKSTITKHYQYQSISLASSKAWLVLINHTLSINTPGFGKMNRLGHQQNAFVGGCVPNGIVCPKPRRVNIPVQSREQIRINSQVGEGCELLDAILTKNFQLSSSPPFFTGSPPIRASNPVIQDELFRGDCELPSPSSAQMTGGSVRMTFRSNIEPVRIEGFNCRRNSGIFSKA